MSEVGAITALDEGAAMSVLDVPMQDNDANAKTVGDYLRTLLRDVWVEEEGFNGKRPFGNSGWKHEVYIALAEAGLIEGQVTYEEEGGYKEWDYNARNGDALVLDAIRELFARG